MQGDNDNHEPMFNLPRVILGFILLSAGIFIGRTWYLGGDGATTFLLTFCFTPLRYQYLMSGNGFPGGWAAGIWSPFTYVFLSPTLQSLIFDLLWLTAFGTAVARRFGPWRFIGFCAAAAAIGAAYSGCCRERARRFCLGRTSSSPLCSVPPSVSFTRPALAAS